MPDAQLYFLSDQYYIDFPDDKLMKNKDTIDGIAHSRPCFLAFPDAKNPAIYWLVPISSRYEKYQKIAQAKIERWTKMPIGARWLFIGKDMRLPMTRVEP